MSYHCLRGYTTTKTALLIFFLASSPAPIVLFADCRPADTVWHIGPVVLGLPEPGPAGAQPPAPLPSTPSFRLAAGGPYIHQGLRCAASHLVTDASKRTPDAALILVRRRWILSCGQLSFFVEIIVKEILVFTFSLIKAGESTGTYKQYFRYIEPKETKKKRAHVRCWFTKIGPQ